MDTKRSRRDAAASDADADEDAARRTHEALVQAGACLGLVLVRQPEGTLEHVPVTAWPHEFPRDKFREAVALAAPFNRLVWRLATVEGGKWMVEMLRPVLATDAFTSKLVEIHERWGGDKAVQPLRLGLFRSDYMLDAPTQRLLQVEINTICVGFAGFAPGVREWHAYARGSGADLPENTCLEDLADALAAAHKAYLGVRPTPTGDHAPRVLIVLQDMKERNPIDARRIELELWRRHHVRCLRATHQEVFDRGLVLPPHEKRALVLDGVEVSVVYFRSGYTPTDYTKPEHWEARERLESSFAIKCPDVGFHLAGAKRIQQVLTEPGALERFVADPAECKQLRACFAGQWSAAPASLPRDVRQRALEKPHAFVLKPQREGGGNNIYGDAVREALESMSPPELSAHVLMELISPAPQRGLLLRHGHAPVFAPVVAELGVFSAILTSGATEILLDKPAGHLLRTKIHGVDEGGVSAGVGFLDSPLLVSSF